RHAVLRANDAREPGNRDGRDELRRIDRAVEQLNAVAARGPEIVVFDRNVEDRRAIRAAELQPVITLRCEGSCEKQRREKSRAHPPEHARDCSALATYD